MNLIKRLKAKIWRMLYGPKRYRYLFREICRIRARRIMEIGTWNGKRTLQMIACASKFSPTEQIEYYGFDLFEMMTPQINQEELSKKPPTMAEVSQALSATGAKIKLFKGFTNQTLPQAVPQLPPMDFIFIDGGHSVETIQNDWDWCSKLMNERTVVIFDDYYFDRDDLGAKAVIEKIDPSKYQVEILPIRDRFQKDWGVLSINFVKVTRK